MALARRGLWLSAAAASALVFTAASAEQPYSHEGPLACLQCHANETIMGIVETPHADFDDPRSPAATREKCESCHGPSATHMQFPMQVGNIVFTKHALTPLEDRNQACLQCHENGQQAHWFDGAHAQKLACASCHTIHRPADPTLSKKGQAQRCGTCHESILSTAPSDAPHPIEGDAALHCTQCHNPHGPTNLTTCVGCHAQDPPTISKQSAKAQGYHARAIDQDIPCTSCHKGIVHALPNFSQVRPSTVEPDTP